MKKLKRDLINGESDDTIAAAAAREPVSSPCLVNGHGPTAAAALQLRHWNDSQLKN